MNEAPQDNESSMPPMIPEFKDRRTGLKVFGILVILLGALCLLFSGFFVFSQVMFSRTTAAPLNMQMMLPAILMYLALAGVFVWLGIGSIQCRRWARALMLIIAWVWLCMGIVMVPITAVMMPRILANAPQGGQAMPANMVTIVVVVQILFMSVFMVLLPGVLVFFYRSRHVKATCEMCDPQIRWTDACPLPLLGVSCMFWFGAAMMIIYPFAYRGVMPFFGTLVSGWTGSLLAICFAGLLFWIARAWYEMKPVGWWMLITFVILMSASNVITFSHIDIMELYQKMGYPQAQVDLIRQQGMMSSQLMVWGTAFWLVPMLGYLLWVKRLFPRTSSPQ